MEPNQAQPMIAMKNVNKIYPNGTVGLKNINLEINRGEFVIVVGLSGAGKSTLLRAINRLHDTTSGEILIDGQSITAAKGNNLRQIRRDIGMIFQNFNLVKRASVLKNVLTGRVGYYSNFKSTFNLFSNADKQKAYEALVRVDMGEKVYNRADELSGGQQQRVSIARVLTQNPKIILADEPVASLDPKTTRKVMEDLKKINQDFGMTVLVNLHSIELAKEFGTRIIGIRAGEVVFDGPVSDTSDAQIAEIYAGQTEAE